MARKRPTLLLEILIALTLIMLAMVPLVRQPIDLYRAKKKQLEQMEAIRICACTYSEIREKFLKGEFRWEEIPSFKTTSRNYELSSISLALPPLLDTELKRKFTLETIKEKEHEGKISRLVSVHITIGTKVSTYRLIVEKGAPS